MLPEGARTWGVKERGGEMRNSGTVTAVYGKLTVSYTGTGGVTHAFSDLILSSTCEVGIVFIPMLQMQKQRYKEARSLAGRQVEEPADHLVPIEGLCPQGIKKG